MNCILKDFSILSTKLIFILSVLEIIPTFILTFCTHTDVIAFEFKTLLKILIRIGIFEYCQEYQGKVSLLYVGNNRCLIGWWITWDKGLYFFSACAALIPIEKSTKKNYFPLF